MNKELRAVADNIIDAAIKAVLPDEAVKKTLKDRKFDGKVILVAVGKAAWQMAKAASDCLGDRINEGIVITKYGHVKEPIERIECFEAGHPVPDENSFKATQAAIEMVSGLNKNDTVLFLLSGGGSALFEKPKITGEELQDITNQLLACGADIVEINTIRKRLSEVKGGRFEKLCEPAHVLSIVLSDILGDPLDMIASGPACADTTTCEEAWHIVEKYNLNISEDVKKLMTSFGYENPDLEETLNRIADAYQDHMNGKRGFPHEIGLVLGYPPVDVEGFIEKEGRDFIMTGYWKVYSNPEKARMIFHEYDRAKDCAVNEYLDGKNIREIALNQRKWRNL